MYLDHISTKRGESFGAILGRVTSHCLDVELTGGFGVSEDRLHHGATLFAGCTEDGDGLLPHFRRC